MEARISLLVVEDEALIAENLRLSLEDLGYTVLHTCYTYAEAVQALATARPDLVLLDINLGTALPGHDGLALAARLSQQQPPVPFVFLTAYSDLDTIRQATQLRPSGYLIKPIGNAALFAAIQTALELGTAQAAADAPTALAPAPAPPDFFFVKLHDQVHKLFWSDVSCLEAGKNYVTLRAADLRTGYPLRGSLTYVLERLLPEALRPLFVRVNRATALNTRFITAYDEHYVYCGSVRYENGRTALAQLQALRLA